MKDPKQHIKKIECYLTPELISLLYELSAICTYPNYCRSNLVLDCTLFCVYGILGAEKGVRMMGKKRKLPTYLHVLQIRLA